MTVPIVSHPEGVAEAAGGNAMSSYRLLYYPLFEPKPTWLRSILLFVDQVERIIPAQAGHTDSRQIRILRDTIEPDPVPVVEPIERDLWINQSDLELMIGAFKLIASKERAKRRTRTLELASEYDFIHRAKIPYEVECLLKDHKLIRYPARGNKLGAVRKAGFMHIQRDAGSLILSYIADRIARRKGLDAITDFSVGFSVNALENQGIHFTHPAGVAEGYLLSSIVSCEIPAELRYLPSDSYLELRSSFSEIRDAFKRLTAELVVINRLHRIENTGVFRQEIQNTAEDFVRQCDKYRRSRFAKKTQKWVPLGIGTVVGIVAALGGPVAAIGGKAAQLSTQVIDKKINRPSSDPVAERTFQMLCSLQRDIIRRSPVKTFLSL
jgi:hypothetical protein